MARIIQTATLNQATIARGDENDWIYNGLDCCVTLEIRDAIKQYLINETQHIYDFSRALQAPVLEMSLRGLRVDQKKRAETLSLYRNQIATLEQNLAAIINEGIGLSTVTSGKSKFWRSVPFLKNLLYGVMKIHPVRKRNANGQMAPTVNREALEKLRDNWLAEPLCNYILKLRDIDKKRMFLETDLDTDDRIRTSYNIGGTNTGRLSSSMSAFSTGGNLQNVDRDLRYVIVADPGMKFANLDLEQADARNVGAICWNLFVESRGEQFAGAYLNACESGDLHTTVCRMAWADLPWTGDAKLDRAIADTIAYRALSYRDLAKKLGHGTNYIGTPPTMAKHTKVSTSLITEFQSRYFSAFPAIREWHLWVIAELKRSSCITSLLGRKRQFFGRPDEGETIRAAVAYNPQSSTADEIDRGLLRLWRANKVQILLQVHDSILIQYPEEREDTLVPWAMETLREPFMLAKGREFVVPVEAKVGWSWGDVEKNKDGSVKKNPNGLIKWTGHDSRTFIDEGKKQLTLRDFL
jgi:DNA polymerase I-like protein with 3'-5' exonuclease and polymerase domains